MKRVVLALGMMSLAFPAMAQQTLMTGSIVGPAGDTLQLNPTAQYNQACNSGAGGIVGQTYSGTQCLPPVSVQASGPSSLATAANTPVATAAAASSLVVKSSAGNLYSWRVTSGASAGFVMVFNATSAPADGAVTPLDCIVLPANSTIGSGVYGIPERSST